MGVNEVSLQVIDIRRGDIGKLTYSITVRYVCPVCMYDHHIYVCMYVCMVITYSRVWINRVRLPILLVVS